MFRYPVPEFLQDLWDLLSECRRLPVAPIVARDVDNLDHVIVSVRCSNPKIVELVAEPYRKSRCFTAVDLAHRLSSVVARGKVSFRADVRIRFPNVRGNSLVIDRAGGGHVLTCCGWRWK